MGWAAEYKLDGPIVAMCDERLTEIRDPLAQLLAQARATGCKQDEALESHRAAVASQRKTQRFGVVAIVVLLALLAVTLFSTYG